MRFQLCSRLSLFCIMISVLASCHSAESSIDEKVNQLAAMECRAITLREQRFALANNIRFTQDTLRQIRTSDSLRLSRNLVSFDQEKEKLFGESSLLADSIRILQDSLRKFMLTTPEDQHRFDDMLRLKLEQMGCK